MTIPDKTCIVVDEPAVMIFATGELELELLEVELTAVKMLSTDSIGVHRFKIGDEE